MSHQQVNKGKGKAAMPGSKANPLIRNVFGTTPMSSTSSSTIGPGTPPDEAMFAAVQDDDDKAGGGGMGKKGLKRTRSLFNLKNASTDNMSIASAASSASMMIRKIGAFGKLASRNRCVSLIPFAAEPSRPRTRTHPLTTTFFPD